MLLRETVLTTSAATAGKFAEAAARYDELLNESCCVSDLDRRLVTHETA